MTNFLFVLLTKIREFTRFGGCAWASLSGTVCIPTVLTPLKFKQPLLLIGSLAVLGGTAALVACDSNSVQDPAQQKSGLKADTAKTPAVKKAAPYKAPITEYATKPYTAAGGYEKTVAKYGPRLGELQAYREKAADVASRDRSCDSVIAAEISSMRGGLNDMHFWVDCENGTRFRFSESELNQANVVAVSEADKVISEDQAVDRCEEMIANSVTHSSTVGINRFAGYNYRKFDQTGAASVNLLFSAKNSFGTELKFNARCTFQSDGSGEITIKERTS